MAHGVLFFFIFLIRLSLCSMITEFFKGISSIDIPVLYFKSYLSLIKQFKCWIFLYFYRASRRYFSTEHCTVLYCTMCKINTISLISAPVLVAEENWFKFFTKV